MFNNTSITLIMKLRALQEKLRPQTASLIKTQAHIHRLTQPLKYFRMFISETKTLRGNDVSMKCCIDI